MIIKIVNDESGIEKMSSHCEEFQEIVTFSTYLFFTFFHCVKLKNKSYSYILLNLSFFLRINLFCFVSSLQSTLKFLLIHAVGRTKKLSWIGLM